MAKHSILLLFALSLLIAARAPHANASARTSKAGGTATLASQPDEPRLVISAGRAAERSLVELTPDGRAVLIGNDDYLTLWDMGKGKEVWRVKTSSPSTFVKFSADGKKLIAISLERDVSVLDVVSGGELLRFKGMAGEITAAALSPDGRSVVTISFAGEARVWDLATGRELFSFQKERAPKAVAFSPDGRYILTGGDDRIVHLWDVTTGNRIRRFIGHSGTITAVAFSQIPSWLSVESRDTILTGSDDGTARLWDRGTGKELVRFVHGAPVTSVTSSFESSLDTPDSTRYVVTGSADMKARLWGAKFEGAEAAIPIIRKQEEQTRSGGGSYVLRTFTGHEAPLSAVTLTPDNKVVLTYSPDSTTRMWDVSTGKELCRLVSFSNGDWAVIDPQGRYETSNGAAIDGLHWVVGSETISLSQLKERYYEPGLLAKVTGFNKEPRRDVSLFRNVKLFPEVKLQPPASGSAALSINLTNRGGGIGRVRVRVNGKEVVADARGRGVNPQADKATLTVNLAGAQVEPNKENTIEVTAWNAEGYLSSRDLRLTWTPAAAAPQAPPELYGIVAGVSKYGDRSINLRYAAKDARDMAQALNVGAKRLFGVERVHLKLLVSDLNDVEAQAARGGTDSGALNLAAELPTKENIRRAFEQVGQRAKPQDVLIIYFSGHGITLPAAFTQGAGGSNANDIYAYLTSEARSTTSQALADPALRAQTLITSEELTEWLTKTEWVRGKQGVPPRKQVMILDTCAAGAAAQKLSEVRDGITSDQIRAIENLKDRTGFHVLMGSAANAVSYEANRYRQGLLTYALLQGMRGEALQQGGNVEVSALFQYAANKVQMLAQGVGGMQRPVIANPHGGASFPVGRVEKSDQEFIPLAPPVPLVLRPMLLGVEGSDDLELTALLRASLREADYRAVTTRGGANGKVIRFSFVDADEMAGAIRPTGTYTVEGDVIKINLVLKLDSKKVNIPVAGNTGNIADLIKRVVEAIDNRVTDF